MLFGEKTSKLGLSGKSQSYAYLLNRKSGAGQECTGFLKKIIREYLFGRATNHLVSNATKVTRRYAQVGGIEGNTMLTIIMFGYEGDKTIVDIGRAKLVCSIMGRRHGIHHLRMEIGVGIGNSLCGIIAQSIASGYS